MLIAEPDMLLLDEPTNYLDILSLPGFHAFTEMERRVSPRHSKLDPLWTKSVHTPWQFIDKNKKMKGGTRQMYRQIAHEETVYEQTRIAMEKKK